MSKAWRWILALGALLLVAGWLTRSASQGVPDGSVLVLELGGTYVDAPVNPLLARLFGRDERSLLSLLSELAKAERDDRLASVVLRIRNLQVGWGKAEEIRAAITRLNDAGRETVALLELEGFGNAEYFVASAATRVVAAPASRNPLVGLAGEYLFLGGLFDKIGVDIEYERIGKYKSAVESYAEDKMSDANREMTTALLDSIQEQFIGGIASGRGLEPEAVEGAIDSAPSHPERMQELGLIDEIAFYEDVLDGFGDATVLDAADYAAVDPASVGFEPVATFAYVHGTGMVVTGEASASPTGGRNLAADTVAHAIRSASEDESISAIVFRIDSPGGSPLASDLVWRAIQDARERMPVIASFSDVAASGGYYVACGADRIVSQPSTYTGSIGVFVLRPSVGGLLEKLGVGVESMTRGARADLLLSSRPLSPQARAVLRDDVRSVYRLFVDRVAQGRELSAEEVDAIGRGRVWTGNQALEVGLVDALGGLRTAVLEAKQAAGLAADADVSLVPYPPPKPLAAQIVEAFGLEARARTSLPLPRSLQQLFAVLNAEPTGAPLLIPPAVIQIR